MIMKYIAVCKYLKEIIMKKKFKKTLIIASIVLTFMLGGCGTSETVDTNASDVEYLEGYENLSEEETTRKLIQEADRIEVVPDDKE